MTTGRQRGVAVRRLTYRFGHTRIYPWGVYPSNQEGRHSPLLRIAGDHMQQLNIDILGMSCDHCVARVTKALQALGVTVKSVDIGSAKVAYDPAVISPDAIAQAVASAGYPAEVAGQAT